jgi:hypothetical protein
MDAPLFELYILFFTLGECEESWGDLIQITPKQSFSDT